MELLNKFKTSTVFTITTDQNLHLYQKEAFKLAYSVRTPSVCLPSATYFDGSAPVPNARDTVADAYA